MAEEINGQSLNVEIINAVAPGAFVAATFVDGADVTMGTTADAAYSGSGTATAIALFKGMYARLAAGTGGGAVTEADGANVTLGAKGDTATTGTGLTNNSFSLIALAKGMYNALVAPIPAGTNVIGGVTEADGANATLGAQANAAWSGSGNGTLIAISKAVYGLLSGQLSIKGAAAAFVAGSFSSGALADGALTTLGSTADAPLAAAASTTGTSGIGVLKGLYNLLFNGAARFQTSIWWTELTQASVAASSTTSGTARTSNGTSGAGGSYGYFTGRVYASVAGTFTIYDTTVSNSPVPCGTVNVAANTMTVLKVPAFGASFTSQFVCGSTAGNLWMSDGFTTA